MDMMKNNKGPVAAVAVVGIGVLGWLAFGFFGIQAAFIDNVVDEEGPVFASGASEVAEAEASTDPAAPSVDSGSDAEASAAIDDDTNDLANAPEQAPVANAPEQAPVEEAPVEQAPVEEAPVEQAPVEQAPPAEEAPAEEPVEEQENQPGEVQTILAGNFSSLPGYSVEGNASVLNDGTDQRFLVFENFVSDNGPDLKVYLRADNGEFISLGDLTGNIGNQNYEIPVDVDLSVFRNVEIWCERFNAGFGVATLAA